MFTCLVEMMVEMSIITQDAIHSARWCVSRLKVQSLGEGLSLDLNLPSNKLCDLRLAT